MKGAGLDVGRRVRRGSGSHRPAQPVDNASSAPVRAANTHPHTLSHTQEYERRLLVKDQEIQSTKERLGRVQRDMELVTSRMSEMQVRTRA